MNYLACLLAILLLTACSSDRDRRAFAERQINSTSATIEAPRIAREPLAPSVRVKERVVLPYEEQGGVKVVQATVNGTLCRFIFDSGASSVCLSLTEVRHMVKNRYLTDVDFIGEEKFIDASGDVNTGMRVNLRDLQLGQIVLHDVEAIIINNENTANLLGQTALEKFGRVTIDYTRKEIVLEGE